MENLKGPEKDFFLELYRPPADVPGIIIQSIDQAESAFALLDGAADPAELVSQSHQSGISGIYGGIRIVDDRSRVGADISFSLELIRLDQDPGIWVPDIGIRCLTQVGDDGTQLYIGLYILLICTIFDVHTASPVSSGRHSGNVIGMIGYDHYEVIGGGDLLFQADRIGIIPVQGGLSFIFYIVFGKNFADFPDVRFPISVLIFEGYGARTGKIIDVFGLPALPSIDFSQFPHLTVRT